MKNPIIAAAAVSLLVAGMVTGLMALVVRAPGTQYPTARVSRLDVTGEVSGFGSLTPVTRYGVSFGLPAALLAPGTDRPVLTPVAKVRWTVLQVKAAAGQSVLKGAVLATANNTDARAQLAQATSDLQLARIRITQAQADLQVATDPAKIQHAQTALANARAGESTAMRTQADLQAQLEHASLVAPADGVVEAVNIIAGADAPPGRGIIVDVGGFQAVVDIGENALAKLPSGTSATLHVSATGQDVAGTVASVGVTPSATPPTGATYPVTFKLAALPADARIGMTVQLKVSLGVARGALAVPVGALRGRPGSYTVLLVTPAGDIQVRAVQIGLMNSALAQVIEGLAKDDMVILDVPGIAPPHATTLPKAPASPKPKKSRLPRSTGAPSRPSPTG